MALSAMSMLDGLLIFLFLDQVGKSNASGPCSSKNYSTLNDVQRSIEYNETTDKCDRDFIIDGIWYRFQNTVGNLILPEKNPGTRRCGTCSPIWMNGKHPTVDGVVKNVTACAVIPLSDPICGTEYNIKVVKCGSFFLYQLKPPNVCDVAYCTVQAGKGFLIYSTAYDKCISFENENITARSCNPLTSNQRWRWTQYDQLQNIFSQRCLSSPETPVNWARLKLSKCDRQDKYQIWECVNEFVRLNGTILNVNYGNLQGGDNVVLYEGTGIWSKWKVYGEDVRVCEKRQAPQTTPTPTAQVTNSRPTSLPDPSTKKVDTKSDNGILRELNKEVDELILKNISVRIKVAKEIIDHLLNVTHPYKMDEGQIENGKDRQFLTDTVKILQKIVNLNISDNNLNILGPASNTLDIRNTKSWRNMTDNKVIRDLVITLENYGFQYGENLKNSSNTSFIVKDYPNVQLRVRYIKDVGNLSLEERLFKFPNASFNLSPDALLKESGAVVVVLWYKTIHSFSGNSFYDDDVYAAINSKIMTVSVRPEPKVKFSEPVRISWDSAELNDSKTCAYWKPRLSENRWKTDGCKRVKDKLYSNCLICECYHLTAFAVMDISRDMLSKDERKALELISTIGCSVSLLGIFLTILIYALLWKRLHKNSRSTIPSQVLMHLCVAIGMTDILAILAGPALKYETFCIAVSILLYFFVLALFGWMLCEGIIIYLQLVKVFSGLGLGGKHLKGFYVIGWGIPVVVVSVLVGVNDREDFITEGACWCGGDGVLFWMFVGTLSLIMLVNLVIFILALKNALSTCEVTSTRSLSSKTTTKATVGTKSRKAKIGLKGSAILLPILGLTWVFGLLVFNRDTIVFKYLFAIFNSLN